MYTGNMLNIKDFLIKCGWNTNHDKELLTF